MSADCSGVTGIVTDLKRFAVHDGDGIRTTVFLKGCPLRCVWCHNPEGLTVSPQIAFYSEKCTGCGNCVSVCRHGVHTLKDGVHRLERTNCVHCEECANVCYTGALHLYGKRMSVQEVLDFVSEDTMFYGGEGGMTLSGGEPTLQHEFCLSLLKEAKKRGINTALDTCGFAQTEIYREVMPYVDTFLFDVKHITEEGHRRCTGQPNSLILENLRFLSESGASVEIRMPLIPGMNDEPDTLNGIGKMLSSLPGKIKKMRVLPYHDYAHGKYASLDCPDTLPRTEPPSLEQVRACEALFRGYSIPVEES